METSVLINNLSIRDVLFIMVQASTELAFDKKQAIFIYELVNRFVSNIQILDTLKSYFIKSTANLI